MLALVYLRLIPSNSSYNQSIFTMVVEPKCKFIHHIKETRKYILRMSFSAWVYTNKMSNTTSIIIIMPYSCIELTRRVQHSIKFNFTPRYDLIGDILCPRQKAFIKMHLLLLLYQNNLDYIVAHYNYFNMKRIISSKCYHFKENNNN